MIIAASVIASFLIFWIIRVIFKTAAARRSLKTRHFAMMREACLCVGCGYDVRACKDVCAECGWPIGADPK